MEAEDIRRLMEARGALRVGHFLRASGRHSDHHVQCAALFTDGVTAEQTGRLLAQRFSDSGARLVLSAALGGILPGYEVSRAMRLPFIYCERRDGAMTLRRGFEIAEGTPVLLIEDEVHTGASVREMAEIVRALRGRVAGIGAIVDKSGGKLRFDAPFESLLSIPVENYAAKNCLLCQQGLPLEASPG